MAVSLKHTTQATGTDAGNGEIGKSQWNEEHTLTLSSGNLLGRSTAGAGAAEEIAIGTGLSLSGGTLSSTVTVSPAGSTTQVQFNDAGAFGADAGLSFNKTSKALTIGGATVTTSSPVLDLAQTWNNAAVAFTGLKLNVTDTASANGSLLMDLQVGGTSQFNIAKNGITTANSNSTNATVINVINTSTNGKSYAIAATGSSNGTGSGNLLFYDNTANAPVLCGNGAFGAWLPNNGRFGFSSNPVLITSASVDTVITRRAAANLRLGAADAAAPVAQTLSVQSVVAGTTNTAGANLTITGSQGTGTGAGGSIIFQVAPAGSSGTAQNALATALTIDSTKDVTFSGNMNVSNGFKILSGVTPWVQIGSTFLKLSSGRGIGWTSTSDASAVEDTVILRDAANTLAQRNGTNAQTFRIYNTYTDASNYERGKISWNANVLEIGTEKLGTGTARDTKITSGGTAYITVSDTTNSISGSTGWADADSIFWQNRCVINTPSNGVLKISNRAQNDFGRLQFGGTTSSFPALKRSTTELQARLADDSGYTTIDAQHRLQGTAPASATATGTAGDIRYDGSYIYVCTASNTWVRAALSTW